LRLTGGCAATVHTDLISLAFSTPARLVVVPLQDFLGLGSGSRMNVPGTTSNNWRWRLEENTLNPAVTEEIRQRVEKSSRDYPKR
jgi:4-alpha-glucanotransferase